MFEPANPEAEASNLDKFMERLGFTEHPTPRSCRTRGRRPHVPSSKSQCQRASKTDALASLILEGYRGAWFLVTVEANRVAHRVGGVASMPGVGFGQQPFCIFISKSLKPAEIRHLRRINGCPVEVPDARISHRIAESAP
jgi:hypothetical protein